MNDISLYFTSIAPNEKEFKEDQIGHSIESFTNEFPEKYIFTQVTIV